MLFKRDLYVEKRQKKSLKRDKSCFIFHSVSCLVFCPIFRRKEIKTIKYRTEIKTKLREFFFRYLAEKKNQKQ